MTRDCCSKLSFFAKQRCMTSLRMLALGTATDVVGEMVRMGESTCLKTTVNFARVVVEVFGAEYLTEPNVQDTQKFLPIGEGTEGFQECSDQLIACIGDGRTALKVCEKCIKVTPKIPPSY
ncbi:hypothetical protein ZWY2020_019782 [Hordeum vulgare]|nr:hypothetical protein ZWY2020_019782 [Hordeum vulgare]